MLRRKVATLTLFAFFSLGIIDAVQSIVLVGFQNYWSRFCYSQPDGFVCNNGSEVTASLVAGAAIFLLGFLLFCKWLRLVGSMRLTTIAIIITLLLVCKIWYMDNHLAEVNLTGEEFLNNWPVITVNWFGEMGAVLAGSLLILLPTQKVARRKSARKRR